MMYCDTRRGVIRPPEIFVMLAGFEEFAHLNRIY